MMRLSRYLARAGIASRRASEQLILDGRVAVNGQVVRELGTQVDEASDAVTFDGAPVRIEDVPFTIMLNKPAGVVTTMSDPQGRPTAASLAPVREHPSLFPVGRLDADTTGLLLFTTDGDMGHALLHPSHHVPKRYRARVSGRFTEAAAERLRAGIVLDDGPCAPAQVRVVEEGRLPVVEVVIHEGRKRQVKRMFQAVGCRVEQLHRASFGPLGLGSLEEGRWRQLTDGEVRALMEAAG